MKNLKQLVAMASLAVLTACATATPYQAADQKGNRNGFAETKIESDRVRISFDGNSLTNRETVETYLLYRAAELTKQSGYDYFVLTDRSTDEKSRVIDTGSNFGPYHGFFDYSYFHPRYGWSSPYYRPYYRSSFNSRWGGHFGGNWGGRFGGYNGFGSQFNYQEITRYKASAEVKFGRGMKPSNQTNAFNASEVMENLGKNIVYPEVEG